MQKIKIPSAVEKELLDATVFSPNEATINRYGILFIHGWGADESGYIPRSEALSKLGFTCLTFNLRGHGNSNGDIKKLTRKDFLDDAISAYDELQKQKTVDKDKIVVVGSSFGGYLTLLLSLKRSINMLALRVPANYPDNGFENIPQVDYKRTAGETMDWRREKLDNDATMSLRAIHQYANDILIVESELDEQIPHQAIKNYIDAIREKSKLTHVVMKKADHSIKDEKHGQEYMDILINWLNSRI